MAIVPAVLDGSFDCLESVCAGTSDRYSPIETNLDANLCLSHLVPLNDPLWRSGCCGGAAPVHCKNIWVTSTIFWLSQLHA